MIKSLTSLRGIFILFIYFHHCLDIYPGGGTLGVTFFFVLSGFSLSLGYYDKVTAPDFCYKRYLSRRCIKFFPLHWLCLLASIPLVLLSFGKLLLPEMIANILLIHSWIPIKEYYFSYNWVSWYLADTMFFAIVFPFLFKWILRSSLFGKILIAIIYATIYISIAMLLPEENYHSVLYISPYMRLTDFVFGIYLALCYLKLKDFCEKRQHGRLTGQIISIAIILLLVVESCLLSDDATWFAPVYWVGIALVIVTTSLTEMIGGGYLLLENKYLQRLGELSFVFFMIHQLILRYITKIFRIIQIDSPIMFVVTTLLTTIVLSVILDNYIVKNITRWLVKRI